MNTLSKILSVFLLCLLFHPKTQAQITSAFDTDADGWTLSDNNLGDPQTVNYSPAGGNPGGYISGTKTSTSQPYYWTSPAKFGGNMAYFSYGQDFSFDIQVDHVGTFHFSTGDIQIRTSSGSILALNLPTFPAQAPAWSSFTIKLDETAGWRVGGTTGPLATKAEMLQYLSGVHSFRIGINYRSGVTSPSSGIDNVSVGQRTIQTAPSITSFSPISGNIGTSVTINGNNFDPAITNNAVYFGGVAGVITNATAAQLTVTVPDGAQHAPITVINKTTGLSKLSAQPFTPTFNDGGRIIPASFKPKFDIPVTGGFGGLNIADIDGDGWNDLVTAAENNNGIEIFRNLAAGGSLSASSFDVRFLVSGGADVNGAGLKVIDLDGDGKLDLVSSTGVSVFTGAFVTFRNISTPGGVNFEFQELWNGKSDESPVYTAADIDGDGLPELIGGEGSGMAGQNVWITQNISTPGNIEFSFPLYYFSSTLDDAASDATISDLNNDGKPEFILIRGFGGALTVFENTSTPGAISFGTNFSITAGINGEINVADFNGDGKNDLAWKQGFSSDDVHIRLNTDTDGVLTDTDFATEIILNSEVSTYGALSLADINGDGKVDILATDNADVGIFENVYSGGTFDAGAFIPGYRFQGNGTSTYPTTALAADLNGDQKPEVVVGITNTSPDRLSIYENVNVHTPVISLTTVSPLAGSIGSTVTITGDHFSTTPSENMVHFGDVNATVLSATKTQLTVTVPAGASYAPVRVTRNQFTASYHLPFNPTFSSGVVFNNTHFGTPVEFTLTGADYDIDAADLNEDGKPDILAEANSNRAYLFRNTHTTGAISATSLLPDDSLTATTTQNPRLIDLNGDNKPDFVATGGVFRNVSVGSEINFEAQTNIGGTLTASPADFNLDGKMDYVGATGANASVFENRMRQGTGAFISGGNYNSISSTFNFSKPAVGGGAVAADFDNDGLTDIACGNGTTDNITVWRNVGTNRIETTTFTSVGNLAAGDNPGRLYVGDMDVDGKMDIVLYHGAGASSAIISIFHNTSTPGNITFNLVNLNPGNSSLAHIDDLDGDGKPEIITVSESSNFFSIFKNIHTAGPITAASFAPPFNTPVTAPRGITTTDINLDGKPEIILTRAAGFLLVYENLVPTIAISITQQPATPYNACDGGSANFVTAASGTTNITYQWQVFDGSVFVDLADNATYTGAATSTLTVSNVSATEAGQYQCVISGDFAPDVITNVADLVFNSLPTPPVVTDGINCGPGDVVLSASGGSPGDYRWYSGSSLTLITGEQNDTYTTPSLSVNTTYHVSIVDPFCESVVVPVTAIISTVPAQPFITGSITPVGNALTICSTTSLTLSAPNGFASYLWSDGSTSPDLSVTASGTYSVTVTNADGCVSPASDDLVITVQPAPCANAAPVIDGSSLSTSIGGTASLDLTNLISDADGNVVLTSLTIIQQPSSGATASLNGTMLQIDYAGISFTGTDVVTIQVCDVFGECATQQFQVTVIGEVEIFTAISPNNDGKNDFFNIQYIDLIEPENTVTIYNRWGDVVFEVERYDNDERAFRGISNKGKELPTGTYYYKIEFQSDQEAKTGFLSLKR